MNGTQNGRETRFCGEGQVLGWVQRPLCPIAHSLCSSWKGPVLVQFQVLRSLGLECSPHMSYLTDPPLVPQALPFPDEVRPFHPASHLLGVVVEC